MEKIEWTKDNFSDLKKLMLEMQRDGYFPGAEFSICNDTDSYEDFVGYRSLMPEEK